MTIKSNLPPLLVFILAIAPSVSVAASFDCQQAKTYVEKTICADPHKLSQMDEDLAQAYREALTQPSDVEALKTRQKQWLSEVRHCETYECVYGQYALRINQLRDGKGAIEYKPSPTPLTLHNLEETRQLLEFQNQQLKAKQKKARDVLFLGAGTQPLNTMREDSIDPTIYVGNTERPDYCKRIWHALETQDSFTIPEPQLFASSPAEKKALFNAVYGYARSNYEHYMAQGGKLSQDSYSWIDGSPKWHGGLHNPKYLPKEFETNWQNNEPTLSFQYNRGADIPRRLSMIDNSIAVQLLYLTPFFVPNYVSPLIITIGKDQCIPCTGLSLAFMGISADGMPVPEFGAGERLNQVGYIGAINLFEADVKPKTRGIPSEPMLLGGVGVFANEFISWSLHQEIFDPVPDERGEFTDAYKDYVSKFRRYTFAVKSINEPAGKLPLLSCSVAFN